VSPTVSWFLKWFAILWSAAAIAIIAISNLMIAQKWPPNFGLPFEVQNNVRVALLLAPGAIAAMGLLALEKWKGHRRAP
jgi:hypothetical protein